MSNVLKKITKKYKWLRFLNYKTTKLAVLSAALFGLCLSSGHSFAKYRDENYGSGNAGAAKFGVELIRDAENTVSTKDIDNINKTGIFVFTATFSISFEKCEVSCIYDLKLKIGLGATSSWETPGSVTKSSFVFNNSTQSTPYTLERQEDNSFAFSKTNVGSSITGVNDFTIASNTPYIAEGTAGNSGIAYDWKPVTDASKFSNVELEVAKEKSAKVNDVHYYKVMYFTNITLDNNEVSVEDFVILYSLSVMQEG